MIHELLSITYPIIQGAMAHIANAEFAASLSNSGCLGIIASGGMSPAMLRDEIRKCKTLTSQPFGVNVMLMNPDSDEKMQIILEEGVNVVTTGAGNPAPYIKSLKEANIKVIPVVANVALAIRLERSGVDAIIAEGCEAGGHVGETTTMALIPQIVAAVSIPVIAAGGIATPQQFNAALALGAQGVQIGTCLLVADECPVHENYKEAVIKAKDSSTVVTGRSTQTPVRILKNQMTNQYLALEEAKATREELEHLTLGALRRAVFDGDVKYGSVMLGQVAGSCTERRPVKEIIETMISGAIRERAVFDEKLMRIQNANQK